MTLLICAILSQDLWDRIRADDPKAEAGRPERRLGPLVDRRGGTIEAARVGFDLGLDNPFSCGGFDLKTSFGSVLNKDIAGDLLGAALNHAKQELAGSSLVLACQMSPTLCDAMKHFRVTANEVLGMQLAECRAIEQKVAGESGALQARAAGSCLAQKQAAGLPLDEALADCRSREELRGLTNRPSAEIDLVREMVDAFGLRPEARQLLAELVDGTRLTAKGRRGDVKLRAIDACYERARSGYEERFLLALKSGSTEGLTPSSLPPVERRDLDLLRVMDEGPRRNAIASIAAAHALVDTARLTHEVRSLLEAAAAMADEPSLRDSLALQSERLGRELDRLRDESDVAGEAMVRRDRAMKASEEDRGAKVRHNTASIRSDAAAREQLEHTRPWGKFCVEPFCPAKEPRR